MEFADESFLLPAVCDRRISSVVPSTVTELDDVYELSNIDLVMKLHYLRGVYYYHGTDLVREMDTPAFKAPMFPLLAAYYPATGRIRLSESGRPVVKCNDSGVRIIEASCNKTLDDWLLLLGKEEEMMSHHRHLVSDQILGPHLDLSPLVLVQFTRFKCGGLAIGLSWPHALGDTASAVNCINMWGKMLGGKLPPKPHRLQNLQTEPPEKNPAKTLPIRQVKTIQDCWLIANEHKMEKFSFQVTETKLKHLLAKISIQDQIPPFEGLSALIWHCLAKFRENREPQMVTICRAKSSSRGGGILGNEQTISTVRTGFFPSQARVAKLATLIAEGVEDERRAIEEQVGRGSGVQDFIVYGANLTFVDLEEINFYGLELKGQKPVLVDYSIDGVGEEGTVLVFHGPEGPGEATGLIGGRTVSVILPEDEVLHLREEFEKGWGIL